MKNFNERIDAAAMYADPGKICQEFINEVFQDQGLNINCPKELARLFFSAWHKDVEMREHFMKEKETQKYFMQAHKALKKLEELGAFSHWKDEGFLSDVDYQPIKEASDRIISYTETSTKRGNPGYWNQPIKKLSRILRPHYKVKNRATEIIKKVLNQMNYPGSLEIRSINSIID